MTVLAIINPVSGRCNLAAKVQEVVRLVVRAGHHMSVRLTQSAGHAAEIAAHADAGVRAILVVGGDGTAREVIHGQLTAGRNIPMCLLRTGTENLVARQFAQPTRPAQVARTLLKGRRAQCDVGQINGRYFLLVSGVGFDAEVVRRLSQSRRGHITHLSYFWPIWRTFWAHRFPELVVWADGDRVFEGRGMVFVGLMPRYSVGLRILKRARPDDGMLDLCVVPCVSRLRLLRHAGGIALRIHDRSPDVFYRKCLEVHIAGPPDVPLEVDGDDAGSLPARYSILPSAATLLVPPD
ncbi:MAG: diacylglycerol/lipid kinase family protein [Phycisphaerae bacterium]